MRNPLEALAARPILNARLDALLGLSRFAARNQPVSAGNRELLLPAMALAIRSHKRFRHLALLRRRGLQAASIHLWYVGDRVVRKYQRLLLRSLVER